MVLSVQIDRYGPDWPLGLITVATSGTPVRITSLIDSTNVNAPETATTSGSNEYSPAFQQIFFRAVKSVGPVVENAGAIYIVRKGVGSGSGNKTDSGSIVAILQPGQWIFLGSAALNRNVFSPYRYYIDADTNGDGCLVTGWVQ